MGLIGMLPERVPDNDGQTLIARLFWNKEEDMLPQLDVILANIERPCTRNEIIRRFRAAFLTQVKCKPRRVFYVKTLAFLNSFTNKESLIPLDNDYLQLASKNKRLGIEESFYTYSPGTRNYESPETIYEQTYTLV